MNEKIALFGAGGKMGVRLSKNLLKSDYRVSHVEPGAAGRQRLKDELGIECVDVDAALDNADVVILAIPDTLIGKISHEIAPKLRAGTMVMTLLGSWGALWVVNRWRSRRTGMHRQAHPE